MQVLHMTLSREPFALIARGIKKEEYRELKPYWASRLEGKTYTHIKFVNGYNPDSPYMLVEYKGLKKRKDCYAIKLGAIVEGTLQERLTALAKELADEGFKESAKLLRTAIKNNTDITIDMDHDEAWDSGLADYLMKNFDFKINKDISFTAFVSMKK